MLSYIKPSKSTAQIQNLNIVSADVAWAAAAYAQRINGSYLKPDRNGYKTISEDDDRIGNKYIMQEVMFRDQKSLTEEDYALGAAARDYHSKKLMMATFKRELSDFERTLTRAVGMDVFTETDRYEIAVIASQIASYQKQMREQKLIDKVGLRHGYLADVGKRLQFVATVISCNYNLNYSTYNIRAITPEGFKVQFFYRDSVAVGKTVEFKGTVKKHLDNITFLNRVTKVN